MSKATSIILTLMLVAISFVSLQAETELSLTISSADNVVDDVDRILALTDEKEQKQREVVKDFLIDYMLPGVNRTVPVKADAMTLEEGYRLRLFVPVVKLRTFRKDALETFDIESTISRKNRKAGIYTLKNAFDGFLKYDAPYAIIVEDMNDLNGHLIMPGDAFAPYAQSNYDIILNLKNPTEGIEQRHTDFGGFRSFFNEYIVRRKEEPAHKFAVRQSLDTHLLEELERIYAESSSLFSSWTLPEDLAAGNFELDLTPIADSSLAKTVSALNEHPSFFAGVAKPENANMSGRILLPVDEMRKENITELATVSKTAFLTEIDKKEDRPAEATEALHQATDLFFNLILENLESGWFDGFAQVYNTEGGQTALGGITTLDGEKAREILKLIPATKEGRTVEMDIDKQGDVSFHKVTFEEGALKTLEQFFGDSKVLFVGTSKEAVWYAAGADALEELKKGITQSAEKSEDKKPFVDISIRVAPWIETIHKARGEQGNSRLHNYATTSFEGQDDQMILQLNQNEDKITGQFQIQKGILRFVGKLISNFSKENLDEE